MAENIRGENCLLHTASSKLSPFFMQICNWDRQSGKTRFIINNATEWLGKNKNHAALILHPDADKLSSVRDKLNLTTNKSITQPYAYINGNLYMAVGSKKSLDIIINHIITNDELKTKCWNVYLDEAAFFAVSYEYLMLQLSKLDVHYLVAMGTNKPKENLLEKLETRISDLPLWCQEEENK